ncbi:MAG: hypothetical protein F4Y00_05325 [Bacteroidetes bacterium SB0662_bin_6]|nr:hypothetical protein [Bacteroidetes bacterium SB0668_bin_1]MYE04377.1 hypothetical protein [Bacteroidetes bacterium SB0662_bin_6]
MTRRVLSILALLVFLVVGCDSNDDDPSDAERFVGTWLATGIRDSNGDQSAELVALVNSLTAVFEAGDENPAFLITVDYKDDSGREDLTLPGTYAVDDGARTLTLTTLIGASLPFMYAFQSDTQVSLSASSAFINPIFNPSTPYEGTVTITVQKQ